MGVVYSGEEVANQEVPQDGAHLKAAQEILERFSSTEHSALSLVYGSVAQGTPTIRSDLDALVTYTVDDPGREPEVVEGYERILEEVKAKTHVKPEANLWPADEVMRARRHRLYDVLFSRHLAESMMDPIWSIGSLDEAILDIANMDYDLSSMIEIIFDYMTYKHNGFSRAPLEYSDTDKDALRIFQRALELPKSTARKIKQLAETVGADVLVGEDGSRLLDEDPDSLVNKNLRGLRAIDKEYSDYLDFLLFDGDKVDERLLADYVGWLDDRYRRAIRMGIVVSSGIIRVTSGIPITSNSVV